MTLTNFELAKKDYEFCKTQRQNYDNLYQAIAERVDPRVANITVQRTAGTDKEDKKFDSTAVIGIQRFAAAISGMVIPRASKWHTLKCSSPDITKYFQGWFDDATQRLFELRYSIKTSFPTAANEMIKGLALFGNNPFLTDEDTEGGSLIYKALPIKDFYVKQNHAGKTDTFFRTFTYKLYQAKQRWNIDELPKKIKELTDDNKDLDFVQYVYPNPAYNPKKINIEGRRFVNFIWCVSTDEVVKESGFYSCPFTMPRADTFPDDVYGYSPCMSLFPEIKMVNFMRRVNIRIGNRIADPSILTGSIDDIVNPDNLLKPNHFVYGGLDETGKPRAMPFEYPSNGFPVASEMIEECRKMINDGLYLSLFNILNETPNATATEVLVRAQEKGIMLEPINERLTSEWLEGVIQREVDILIRAGQMPEMPQELEEAIFSEGAKLSIEYDSPLTRALKAEETAGVLETVNLADAFAQVEPRMKYIIKKGDVLRDFAKVKGVNANRLRTDEEIDELMAQEQQAAQVQQALQAAPVVAAAAEKMSKAQQQQAPLL
ncbi:MAG: hypothetical protein LBL00_03840 [Endomicrobium sp.]|jgi:hypothetical protein|nr:hypothetical protein [Endomicrobium sp.]